MRSIVATFTMLSVFAVGAASPFKPLQVLPRGDIYQEGGDLAKALREGFAIVLEVKMGENGKLAGETERTLALIPGGRKVLVRWRTDDPRSVPLFAEALNLHPALFEKEYIFVAPGPLAQEIGDVTLRRLAFVYPDGLALPAVCLTRKGTAADAPRMLLTGSHGLVAEGSVAIAAAHAFAADRSLFGSVDARNAPPGWPEFLDKPGVPPPYRYTWCVNGALKHYDWKDLLK